MGSQVVHLYFSSDFDQLNLSSTHFFSSSGGYIPRGGHEVFHWNLFYYFADLKREMKSFSSCNHKDRERIYSVSITKKQIQNKGKTLLPGCINISSNTMQKKKKKSPQGIVKCSWAYLSTGSRSWKPEVSCIPAGFSFLLSSPWAF